VIPASRPRNYLQSALYVIVAGILATVLLERLLTYAEAAEKAAMEATISQLQAGVYARVAFLALKGDYAGIEALPQRSPFVTALVQAQNYRGEFMGVPPEIAGGSWLYDQLRNELVYVPNLTRHLVADPKEPTAAYLRFHLELQQASKHGYSGVTLRPVTSFRWDPVQ
jgi:hypothetical protein